MKTPNCVETDVKLIERIISEVVMRSHFVILFDLDLNKQMTILINMLLMLVLGHHNTKSNRNLTLA